MSEQFELFLEAIDFRYQEFVKEMDEYLLNNNCKLEFKENKSGLVVSYIRKQNKRTLVTYVTRKSGVKIRIFPQNIGSYEVFLNTLPEKMKKEIIKSSPCKRLIDPNACNERCVKGYDFYLDDERYTKCRYMAFMPSLSEENNPFIKLFIQHEFQVS